MDIITVDDLAAYLRDDTVSGDAAADLIVQLANGLVTEVIGETTEVTARTQAVTYEVAARAYRNPEGYSSETIDDYTYRRDAETRQAGVYLTGTERAMLLGTVTGTRASKVAWLA